MPPPPSSRPPDPTARPAHPRTWGVWAALWVLAVCSGLLGLADYQTAPASDGRPPERWPADVTPALAPGRPTMLLFVHPHCPCTRATLTELCEILARDGDGVALRVVVARPPGVSAGWHLGPLVEGLAAVPGADLVLDDDCRLARRFDVLTSGTALLYDEQGRLRFSGGLTAGRGHEGDNGGHDAVARLLSGRDLGPDTSALCAPAFGCGLFDDRARDENRQ